MKKNKGFENRNLKKHYIKLIIYNMSAFLIVFIILGFVFGEIVDRTFYSDLKDDMQLCKTENENMILKQGTSYRLSIDNARIMAILYDQNKTRLAYSSEIANYIIPDYSFGPDLNRVEVINTYFNQAKVCALSSDYDEVLFEQISVEDNIYNFMTLSFKVTNQDTSDVSYCKLLVMINGEMNTRNKMISVYLFASSVLILMGIIASLILSSHAIKPIGENINKQLAFVSDASHELRTPLSIVQSKLENILTKRDASVMDVSEDIAISLKEVSRLSKLTNDLLVLAKSDNDTTVMNVTSENIKEVVSDTIMIFKEMSELEERTFELDIEDINIDIDKGKIIQLIVILLDNALKYTNQGDDIHIEIKKDNTECYINVSDTGIGISDETKKKIFERFYREDKARSRVTGGNGLGLAIAKTIVMQHNGKISVDHNQPKGTRFSVSLPLKNKKIKNS